MDTVLTMVSERGDAGDVTLREVARRAGVSHNAPYRHFADKEALLAAIATEGFGLLTADLRAARGGAADGRERFVATGMAYVRFARRHRGYLAVMHGPGVAKGHTADLQRAANETFQILKEGVGDARAVDPARARQLGTVVWAFLYGLTTLYDNHQVPASVGASAEQLVELGLSHFFRSFERGPA